MIVGIICGYYRSGTTPMQMYIEMLMKDSVAVIHEPCNRDIVDMFNKVGINDIDTLHNYTIFSGYGRIEKELFDEFLEKHKEVFKNHDNGSIMFDYKDTVRLLDVIDNSDYDFVIKTTQSFPLLNRLVNRYECWGISPVRRIAINTYNHFSSLDDFKEALKIKNMGAFYVDEVFDAIVREYKENINPSNVIDKLVYNIATCNSVIMSYRNNTRIYIIDFDDLVYRPNRYKHELPFDLDYDIFNQVFSVSKLNKPDNFVIECIEQSIRNIFMKKMVGSKYATKV